ncbi:primosomal protein N' [Cryomorpha ignava]|uniref:Replication restart protein PriA n=1 Tax=Cryomorpha ignava TaxID=101383 RepID=A0A7K3WLH4_9FLAO|nr:primosomal protein N' [Cryomorpha ignava]NEN22493.1 primosomal protein N' [Cryomorpha ignava]
MKTYFAEILLPLAVPNSFTYRIPKNMEPYVHLGLRVVVPFGKQKILTGIVISIHETPPSAYVAKYIDSLLDDEAIVTPQQIQFWEWMAGYYLCNRGDILLAALPGGLRLASESKYILNPAFDGDLSRFNERECQLIEILSKREVLDSKEVSEALGIKSIQKTLKNLLEGEAILIMEDLKERYKPKLETYVKLSDGVNDEDGLEAAFKAVQSAARQEEALMMYIQLSNRYGDIIHEVKKTVLQKRANVTSSVVKDLVKKGIFELEEREVGRLPKVEEGKTEEVEFNEFQLKALTEIKSLFETKDTVLLHGITSSGKTEIYTHLIREQLDKGKQVLYILPEIALTTQMIQRLQRYFGNTVAVYHSKFNQNERVEIWNLVLKNDGERGSLILGARSAVFLPFSNLGLVIVDEEHETSFKQFEPAPRYHARDSAIVLASIHGAKTLLGSATPSYESVYNAKMGKYGYVTINERYGGMELPEITTASLSKKNAPTGYFTQELLKEIKGSLDLKEQVILFQNRRGYAPVLLCEMCGWSPECTRCDVTLTFHKSQDRLVCHYCGSKYQSPHLCAACGSHKLKLAGFGTERIEEEILIQFPDAKVARLDLDSTRTKYGYQKILSDFQDGFIDILIGTQMVTKGLDFGKVNLVGILNADLLLKFPDFRSTERGFQLMTQVAGRAGRRQKRGKVIIQSHDPQQWVIQQVVEGNYDAVAKKELGERRKFLYPPFARLIMLTFRHKQVELVDFTAASYHKELCAFIDEANVLGPEYPAVSRVKNRFNKHIIIKIDRKFNIATVKAKIHSLNNRFFSDKQFKEVRLIINVDPQ